MSGGGARSDRVDATGSSCSGRPQDAGRRTCPISNGPGRPVAWRTVAALALDAVPERQELFLCMDPDCEAIYFGESGLVLRRGEVREVPAHKAGGEGLVCFCFLHRRAEVEAEARAGTDRIFTAIREQVRAGNCACDVRNPTGCCCLGDVRSAMDRATRGG